MRADDDPLVGRDTAGNAADDVDETPLRVFHLQLHVDLRRSGADVIRDRQRAAPRLGRDRTFQSLEQLHAVAIRHRLHRNRRERFDLVHRNPLDARLRRTARRRRIARIPRHVHHAAALNHAGAAERTVGIDLALEVAVFVRIRIDDAGDRAVLGGDLRLDAAPAAAVPREDDFAFHVDAELRERLVVGRDAEVDVDDLARHVARRRIGVVGRQNPRLVGPLIAADLFFLDLQPHLIGRGDLHAPLAGPRQEDAVLVLRRIDAERLELVGDVVGELDLVRRAGVMRLRRHHVEVELVCFRVRRRFHLLFARTFCCARRGGKPADGLRRGLPRALSGRRLRRQPGDGRRRRAQRNNRNQCPVSRHHDFP